MPSAIGLPRSASVLQDWRQPLSPEKSIPYLHTLRLLEMSYSIFSVNLDEAIGLRRCGQLDKSYISLSLTAALCQRLGGNVQTLLRAMLSHAKHFQITPSSSPLDPENFRLGSSRRAANFSGLRCRVILSRRSQFLHKLSTLLDMIGDLEKAFGRAVVDLKDSRSRAAENEWDTLDAVHYDLNTCLREAIVLLKCFLQVFPAERVSEFSAALQAQPVHSTSRVVPPKQNLAHGRMALVKGQ